jgi:superfamily II DNA or RNA helicase
VQGLPLYRFDYPSAYEYCIEKNESYHHLIADIAKQEIDNGLTTLIFVDRIWQGMSIKDKLNDRKVDNLFINGQTPSFARNDAMAKFRSGQLPCIISTNILDEGVDVPKINVLILTSGGKSAIRVLQRVGRALRKKAKGELNVAKIIDFQHLGNEHLENHSDERLKIYRKEKFDITTDPTIEIQ